MSVHWMLLSLLSYSLPVHFLGFFSLTISVGRGTLMSPLLELNWQLFSLRGCMAKWSRELTGESNRLAVTFLAVPTWIKYPASGCKCIKWDGQTQYVTLTLWWPLFQFLDICACVCVCSVVSNSLWLPCTVPTRKFPWNSPGKNTAVGCHSLLQGIFLTQGWNLSLLCLLHWQMDSLSLAPPGKPIHLCISM